MRVLLDATIVKPGLGGIASYAERLARALLDQPDVDLVVTASDTARFVDAEVLPVSPATQSFGARTIWREVELTRIVRRAGIDVVLVPAPEVAVAAGSVPQVAVVHDLRPIVASRYDTMLRRARFHALLPAALKRAAAVVAVSEFTANHIREVVGPGPTVHVIPEGPGPVVDAICTGRFRAPDESFALCVAEDRPHKNLSPVLEAFGAAPPMPLLIAGHAGRRRPQPSSVSILGWVSLSELRHLYECASLLIVPSLFEGFGLPLLEGLLLGRGQVVASDLPSFREISPSLPHFVRAPEVPAAWRDAVDFAATSPRPWRDIVEERSRLHGVFSWARVGDEMLKVLRAVLESRSAVAA